MLQACDLGDFSPVDVFSKEPLEEDALSLDVGTSCDFSILVNNDRYIETTTGLEIKGSAYLETTESQYYLSSGEFQLLTDTEGKVISFEGYGTATFPETPFFEDAEVLGNYAGEITLLQNPDLSSFFSLSIDEDQCFINYNIDQDTAKIVTSNGNFSYTELYFEPVEPFLLFNGTLELPSLQTNFGWTGISHDGNIEFLPENFTQELTFEPFNGHVYIDGALPFLVNNLPVNSNGENIINASIGGDAKSFFDGDTESIEQGTNGNLEISYLLADTIIAEFTFYSDTVSRTSENLILSAATSHWTNLNGVEDFTFVGDYNDSIDLYREVLVTHPVLEQLTFDTTSTAVVFGNYGTNFNLWAINILNNAGLDLGEQGEYTFKDAILSVTTSGIEFSGIFESPFDVFPNMLIAGEIQDNGDFIFNGQNLFAVNFNGTTLPVTFSLEIEMINGNTAINITGLAEYCENGNCQFLPVTSSLDIENQALELCVEIPNEGTVCID